MRTTRARPSPNHRVVVTGLGAITPLGLNVDTTWQSLTKGQSGIDRITKFDPTPFRTQIAGEVKGFAPETYIEKKELKKMDTFIHYSIAATQMALSQAGLTTISDELAPRVGCFIGSGMGGLPIIEEQFQKYFEKGPNRISPFFIPAVITNLAAGQVSIYFNLKGPNYSITSACATGAHSIGEAVRTIREGLVDVMVAGGTEATVCPLAIGGFGALTALSERNAEPSHASRPWDKARDGFVLAEGAGILILESLEHALKRGANILCEVSGYGASSDAYHMTGMAPEGVGGQQAMRAALLDASLNPRDIDYINAHGTSTPLGDPTESTAIEKVWGQEAKNVWVSSTKSMMGHTLGAAGAIESIVCIQAITTGVVPPTINLQTPDENCRLDYVANEARSRKVRHALNNSFGFGGTNACLVFSAFDGATP